MFIVGIAGGSGAGKTTFANKILKYSKYNEAQLLHMDCYYLPTPPKKLISEACMPNFDHPHAFDWALLKEQLRDLKNGKAVQCPTYNFAKCQREETTVTLGPCKVLIFEGIFSLFDKEIRDLFDIKCFLFVDSDIRFIRRLHRDVKERGRSLESVIEQYYDTVRPMHQMYLEPQRQYADFIVGEETDNSAIILSAKIDQVISQAR